MRYYVRVGDREVEVDLTEEGPLVDGVALPGTLSGVPGTPMRLLHLGGATLPFQARRLDGEEGWEIVVSGERHVVTAVDARSHAIRSMTGDAAAARPRAVVAPMPGLVLRVEVSVGQAVRAGQAVAVVEAMKMENELTAPADGVVARIEVSAGQTVEKGATLLVLE